MLIFALALAAPTPLTETHQRDIGCVALLGLVAERQRKGIHLDEGGFPDVRARGKVWAGIVGERVVRESGQPREIVAFAIMEAVDAERAKVDEVNDPDKPIFVRERQCLVYLEADLVVSEPLPKPVRK